VLFASQLDSTSSTLEITSTTAQAQQTPSLSTKAIIMSDKAKGGKIVDPKVADTTLGLLDDAGKASQERRREAQEKQQKEKDMKELMDKTGKDSQERRGRGPGMSQQQLCVNLTL